MNRVVPVVLSLAFVLAGCGDGTGPGGAPTPGPDVPTGTALPPTTLPTPSPELVAPREGLVEVRPRPWDEARVETPRTLLIVFTSGPEECFGLDRVDVDEDAGTVTVTLYEGRVPEAEVCIEIAVVKGVRVRLDEPVGDRRIVDGAEPS